MRNFQFFNQLKSTSVTLIKNVILVSWMLALLIVAIEIGTGRLRLLMATSINNPLGFLSGV